MPFKVDSFVTNYIGVPVFFVFWAGYKLLKRTKVIPPEHVDLVTGIREIDEEEKKYLLEEAAKGPQKWYQKLWDSL